MMLHIVFKVAKAMAPSVIYIDEVEKVFLSDKKKLKEFHSFEPYNRIKKDLVKARRRRRRRAHAPYALTEEATDGPDLERQGHAARGVHPSIAACEGSGLPTNTRQRRARDN